MSEQLPKGWSWLRLEDFAASEPNAITDGPFGSNLKSSDYVEGGEVRVIRLGNLGVGRFIDDDKSFVTKAKFATLTKHEARAGDLVVAALAEPVGRCVEIPERVGLAMVKADCIRVRVNPVFDRRYLMHALNSPDGRRRAEAAAHGMGRLRINLGDLRTLMIPAAPPDEQRRIVAKLEALQSQSRRAREALDAVPTLLEKLRQSILGAAFRGDLTKDWRAKKKDVEPASKLLERIRAERRKKSEESELAKLKARGKAPTDDKWKAKYKEPAPVDTTGLPELPEGWCWAAWREVGFSQNGRAFPSAEYSEDGEKLLRPGNLHVSGKLDWTAANTRRMPHKWAQEFPDFIVGENELVMNLTAQSLKDEFLGRVCLSGPGERCLLNQRLARLTPVGLPPHYWLWFFKSPMFRRYVDTLNTGSLIQHMFTSQLDELAVPIMPIAEANLLIERISGRLESARAITILVNEESARLPELDRALLAKAFRGELVPQEPNDESAATMLARLHQPSSANIRNARATKVKRTTRGINGPRQEEA